MSSAVDRIAADADRAMEAWTRAWDDVWTRVGALPTWAGRDLAIRTLAGTARARKVQPWIGAAYGDVLTRHHRERERGAERWDEHDK